MSRVIPQTEVSTPDLSRHEDGPNLPLVPTCYDLVPSSQGKAKPIAPRLTVRPSRHTTNLAGTPGNTAREPVDGRYTAA